MNVSPAMRCSPGRELRGGNHKRGFSLESGIVFKERDDDLALFNEMQSKESDSFLLQSNDDFEDSFVTKLRHFSDHKHGINIAARGESSDLLNSGEEKNDYEWLITPPDTPLFASMDDETPQVIHPQRGRPRAQPISISRSSTMEKSHRSSRGSPSPNRLSPSPRSHEPTFQPRNRATSAPSSSPPATRRPVTGSRRPSSPSSKPSSPPPRASPQTSRRLSTGSTGTMKGISGNSASPKVMAWQVNIPGFSTEAPPNLRTSLADRPASYQRGSSPASRNGRKSKSPTASRSLSMSSSRSKGSVTSSADDDVESLPYITVDGSQRSSSKRVGGVRNNNYNNSYNKVPSPQKPSRPVPSSSAPKRSFDMALRQMDHRKGPQNMFRPLLSSVPTSNFYAGKSSPAWNSSVTTSSNASSDLGASGPHDIEEDELNDDDATSGVTNIPDSSYDHEVIFMLENPDSKNEDTTNEIHDISPYEDSFEDHVQHDTANHFNGQDDVLVCSRCGCEFSIMTQTEDEIELCLICQKSTSSLTISDTVTSVVAVASSEAESAMSDKDNELFNTRKPQSTVLKDESSELTCKESQSEQLEDLVKDGKDESSELTCKGESQSEHLQDLVKDGKDEYSELICKGESQSEQLEDLVRDGGEREQSQLDHDIISQPILSCNDTRGEQIQHAVDLPKSKVDSVETEAISTVLLKRSSSIIKGPVTRSGTFSASSISYDALSYMSASSSVDFGPRLQRQLSSRKSDIENYKYDPMNVKHQRSISSLSGTSSHAFHPSSVGTSTLDSFEVPVVRAERDVADSASVGPQENPCENDTCTENVDSREVLLPELLNDEEPASSQKVEDLAEDTNSLTTCAVEEGTSLAPGVDSTDVTEVQLSALSEGEVDHTCSSSPASQCHSTQHSESSIEEFQDPHVSAAVHKDMAISATDLNTLNHSSSITEESMVLVEGQGGTKGKSLTLEEATDTILFCSSIVHSLAYEAANIAMEKESSSEPSGDNDYWPLVPAVPKSHSGRKDLQSRKTSKRSKKSRKIRKKTMEEDTVKTPNSINSGEETDLPKTRIIHSNNKENTKPPILEAKCNCRIM
ncbi:hypothetical protein SSX86_017370 [Deinandra increscens subsp. villosa]|uniref:Uncharacterized protein n=1 Tax=Deinandra increscens subsp. villosa TaxID=3103831 RepID=A0AAP0CZR9_9ASTR